MSNIANFFQDEKRLVRSIQNNLFKIFLGIGLVFSFLFFRPVFFLLLFVVLDFFNTSFERIYHFNIPVDFIFVGSIFFGYMGYFAYGIILALFLLLNRLIMLNLETRHLYKPVLLFPLIFLVGFFNFLPLVLVGQLAYVLRYFVEILIEISFLGGINSERILQRIANFFGAGFFFFSIGNILISLL